MSDLATIDASSATGPAIQYVPFSSALDAGFWHKLTQLILDVYGLNDELRNLHGYYTNYDADGIPPHLNVDYTAFNEVFETPRRTFLSRGHLKKCNTIEEFKNCDKKILLDTEGLLDLKKYHYYYWFAFPAVSFPCNISVLSDPTPITQRFNDEQIASLASGFDNLVTTNGSSAFLVLEMQKDGVSSIEVGHLKDFNSFISRSNSKILLGFSDPSTVQTHAGWPLRNLLALAAHHWSTMLSGRVEVVCWRDRYKDGQRQMRHSIILNVSLPPITASPTCGGDSLEGACDVEIKFVGWEKNEKHKLGPRMVDLSTSMDPNKLAESAVDLNLKLMRWRLLPGLDLNLISRTRCLLLGAGTLGCNVARCLLGWGVRNITLIDNSTVSYSNPVRQSLFQFDDSLNGGKPKAETAALALKRIFPGVNAVGLSLSIPMPGHMIPDSLLESTRKDVNQLEAAIESHDVVLLLMDTRESRWLPTVIGKSKNKIVLSSALGFDTYLVVRHGVKRVEPTSQPTNPSLATDMAQDSRRGGTSRLPKSISGNSLGCYFCNDVVAPGDSTQDRTLDQQCTVSRPGLSMTAAALTVELLMTILVHPLRCGAPADISAQEQHLSDDTASPLGVVPHQIRGFLSMFQHILPASYAFDRCTACSPKVLEAYETEGFDFLWNVFNRPSYLEDLTGLTELHVGAEDLDNMSFTMDDDDDDDNEI